MRDWTAHSEEIARISQDLAKDLAMLAREIHDVAGEIDSVSPALEERVFDDSLELGGPSAEHSGTGGTNGRSVELRPRGTSGSRSIRRQTWNRDDVSCGFTSLDYYNKHIFTCCHLIYFCNRILFKDKELKWEEIESKLQAEHDSLLLKSSNKEISTIIQDLRRVERQLLVIDMMVDPDGTLDALTTLGLTSPLSDQKISPRAQLGASGLLQPGPETSSVVTTASRPEGPEPCGPSEQAEV
uniref:CEP170 C-terminal domain-containing protein n=1 Tax=Sphaeramia orbicularis TaxID=375764 RepID=A0A673C6T8_9TELE